MQICRMNSECGRNSLKYRGPVIWNCLPESMRSIDSKERFKRELKRQAFKLKGMTFIKETTFNTNRKDDYVYFDLHLFTFLNVNLIFIFLDFHLN